MALWWPYGGGLFLIGEVPLQGRQYRSSKGGVPTDNVAERWSDPNRKVFRTCEDRVLEELSLECRLPVREFPSAMVPPQNLNPKPQTSTLDPTGVPRS